MQVQVSFPKPNFSSEAAFEAFSEAAQGAGVKVTHGVATLFLNGEWENVKEFADYMVEFNKRAFAPIFEEV